MSKHTPGPWHWSISPRFKDIRLDNTAGLVVMDFSRWGMQSAQPRFRGVLDVMFDTSDMIEADGVWPHPDARLIAAAPELLEQLRRMIDCCYRCDGSGTIGSDKPCSVCADARALVESLK